MLAPNARAGQVTGEQAHLEGEEKTFFASHRALNPELNFARRVASIADGHGRILSRS